MLSHQDLIDRSKLMFPKTTDSIGMCYGVAMMAMQAILAGNINSFNKLLSLIERMPLAAFGDISRTIWVDEVVNANKRLSLNNTQQDRLASFKKKHNVQFELKWEDLIDIEAFFTGVNLYMTPQHDEFSGLFGSGEARPKVQLDSDRLLSLLPINVIRKDESQSMNRDHRNHEDKKDSSNDVIQQQTIHQFMSFSGCYDKSELLKYFETFAENYPPSQYQQPVSFVLVNQCHAIAVGYDPKHNPNKPWLFVDADQLPAKACDAASIVDYVFYALARYERHVYFNTTTYAIKNVVNEIVVQAKNSSTKITNEECNRLPDKIKNIRNANKYAEDLFNEISKKLHSEAWKKYPEMNLDNAKRTSLLGVSWLHMATMFGHTDQVKGLIKLLVWGSNVSSDYINRAVKPNDFTPLWVAAENGHLEVVEVLIKCGANIDQVCNGGTPLFIAAQTGYGDVVKVLIDAKANIDQICNGYTPLYVAAQNGHLEVVKVLIDGKANIDWIYKGFTPLYVAAQQGHADVVKALIDAKANIDQICNGYTPLWIAAHNGHLEVVKTLIMAGANANQAGSGRDTPLDIAKKIGNEAVANFIEKHNLLSRVSIFSQSDSPASPTLFGESHYKALGSTVKKLKEEAEAPKGVHWAWVD